MERDPADSEERATEQSRVAPPGTGKAADPPVLPDRSSDDLDTGWGDDFWNDRPNRGSGGRDAEWYRRERPPHHE